MKIIIFFSIFWLALTGCRTTEANYRAAYQAARAAADARAADDDDGLDPETRAMLERQKLRGVTRQVVGTDTLLITTLFVKMTAGVPERVPRYSVAINSFSQRFNALALMHRLHDNGYPQAYVFETGAPQYYVATAGTNALDSLPTLLQAATNAPAIAPPYPGIIQSGGFRP